MGRVNGPAEAAEPGNVVAHHDVDHDDAARHESLVDLGPDDGPALIANAKRRHGTLGGVVAAGMFGLDQALGRRVKQETQVVVAAPTEPVDIARVVMMLLVHDLVEIDAGDVFVYAMNDSAVAAQQDADEQRAADRIFALLPLDQGAELRALWDEFESKATPESRFAKTIDRLQPLLLNRASGGGSWSLHSVTADMTANLIRRTMQKDSVLTDYALALVDQAVVDGVLLPPNPNAASS